MANSCKSNNTKPCMRGANKNFANSMRAAIDQRKKTRERISYFKKLTKELGHLLTTGLVIT